MAEVHQYPTRRVYYGRHRDRHSVNLTIHILVCTNILLDHGNFFLQQISSFPCSVDSACLWRPQRMTALWLVIQQDSAKLPYRGLMLADYHLIRKYRLKLSDLYRGDSTSIYWFRHGVNWRAFAAFTAGMWPLLREFLPLSMFCNSCMSQV